MSDKMRQSRIAKEVKMLALDPPPGVSCWMVEDNINKLEAKVAPFEGSIYEHGVFKLEITIPTRYPFEPPRVKFETKIYHPNVDDAGRICLDIIKLPPSGSWKPSMNISSVLSSILLLMNEPNPEDPLMVDIATEFKHNKELFVRKAREWCVKYAVQSNEPVAQDEESSEDESSDDDDDDDDNETVTNNIDTTATVSNPPTPAAAISTSTTSSTTSTSTSTLIASSTSTPSVRKRTAEVTSTLTTHKRNHTSL